MLIQDVMKSAVLSKCMKYRYLLIREWSQKPKLAWIMLNPSTADGSEDDATIRVCMGRAQQMGAGGIIVCNLFAYRATDPNTLLQVLDPVGPFNDDYIRREVINRPTPPPAVICAWGDMGDFMDRGKIVHRMLVRNHLYVYCLGLTQAGFPRHPLRIPYSFQPKSYSL